MWRPFNLLMTYVIPPAPPIPRESLAKVWHTQAESTESIKAPPPQEGRRRLLGPLDTQQVINYQPVQKLTETAVVTQALLE